LRIADCGLRIADCDCGLRIADCEVGRRRGALWRRSGKAFFRLRDRFRAGEISLPDDRTLADQLAALTYWVDAKGK
jgi:hypothetical protein